MKESPDKSKSKIESMFDDIAPAYDRLNHLFTLNIDIKWRKEIVKYIRKNNYSREVLLDLATGTGDLSRELLSLSPLKIYAADISRKMLDIQKIKVNSDRLILVRADAQSLPFDDEYFDIVTIGFGVRNFENTELSLREINRVLKKNGKLIILEMFRGEGFKTGLFNLYFGKVMPYIGNKISGSSAYSYLFRSVDTFLNVKEFTDLSSKCNFETDFLKNNFLGIVNTLYLTKKTDC